MERELQPASRRTEFSTRPPCICLQRNMDSCTPVKELFVSGRVIGSLSGICHLAPRGLDGWGVGTISGQLLLISEYQKVWIVYEGGHYSLCGYYNEEIWYTIGRFKFGSVNHHPPMYLLVRYSMHIVP